MKQAWSDQDNIEKAECAIHIHDWSWFEESSESEDEDETDTSEADNILFGGSSKNKLLKGRCFI